MLMIKINNKILETTKYVVDNSKFVKINKLMIPDFSKTISIGASTNWIMWMNNSSFLNFNNLSDEEKLHFIFVLNSISFSYWGEPNWEIKYRGNKYNGATAMTIALNQAIKNGFNILDFSYNSKMKEGDLKEILKSENEIPLFKERLKILRESGKIIMDKYDGQLINLINKTNGNHQKLLKLILKDFPSFQDYSIYKYKEIFFWKRAQLFIADIYWVFKEKKLIKNINEITACADYKLPQILIEKNILKYSEELSQKINKKKRNIKRLTRRGRNKGQYYLGCRVN